VVAVSETPRYNFPPLERRGLLFGLGPAQLCTMAAGTIAALVAHAAIGGPAGTGAAVVLVVAVLAATLWSRNGRPVGGWAVLGLAWLSRRSWVVRLDERPLAGVAVTTTSGGPARPEPSPRQPGRRSRRQPPGRQPRPRHLPPGIELDEDPGVPGEQPMCLIHDRQARTWAAVLPVRGCSFSLLDPVAQGQKLEGWRGVLGAVGRPGSPVARLQWVQRSSPAGGSGGSAPLPGPDEGPAPVSYGRLVDCAVPPMLCHQTWLVVVVAGSGRSPGGRPPGTGAHGRRSALRREVRLLEGQLRAAELDPGRPLALREMSDLIRSVSDPAAEVGHSRPGPGPWPLAASDSWSSYRADGSWHATYWIAEWPRLDVGPDFLGALLAGTSRRSVSVVMAPVPADRALREIRSARTADLADAELRARAGFLQSARRDRESEGVARREAELADGHGEYRFAGYVTVTARDPETLATSCAEAEHAAQTARVEIRRLYGRQAEAFTWTLPLGRGLR
jgi:hypothetical protein